MLMGIDIGFSRKKTWFQRWLSLALGCLLTFLLTINLGIAQETEKPQPPESWQMRGIMAALDDPDPEIWIKALEQLNTFDLENVGDRI